MGKSMGKSMVSGSDSSLKHLKPLDHGVWLKCPVRTGRSASFHHSFGHWARGDEWCRETNCVGEGEGKHLRAPPCLPATRFYREGDSLL